MTAETKVPEAEAPRARSVVIAACKELATVKHGTRVVLLVLVGQFAGHTGWYAFEHLATATGLNPHAVVAIASGPIGIPVAVVLVVAFSIAEDRVHERRVNR